jgi:hypothetical protein
MSVELQQELRKVIRSRLGIPVGIVRTKGKRIEIECDSIADCDRILDKPEKMCEAGLAMGYDKVKISVGNTPLCWRFSLKALSTLNKQLGG